MIFKDYYKILGLPNSNVTTEQIKQAYREQAKKYHPDINTTSNFSEERFKDIMKHIKLCQILLQEGNMTECGILV